MNELNARFAKLFQRDEIPVQVWPAVVTDVQKVTCTVKLSGTDLDVPGVNLRADEDAPEGVLAIPRVGSLVYVASVENTLDSLFVCLCSEVDAVRVAIGPVVVDISKDGLTARMDNRQMVMDADGLAFKQGSVGVQLAQGKVSVTNGTVSLKSLFSDLTDLLTSFQVTCASPGAPSAPFPASVAKVTQLQAKVNALLA